MHDSWAKGLVPLLNVSLNFPRKLGWSRDQVVRTLFSRTHHFIKLSGVLSSLVLLGGCYGNDIIALPCDADCSRALDTDISVVAGDASNQVSSALGGSQGQVQGASTEGCAPIDLLKNGNFEKSNTTASLDPLVVGRDAISWFGDGHKIVDAAAVAPRQGRYTLQFLSTTGMAGGGKWQSSSVEQMIDIQKYKDLVGSSQQEIVLSAYFYRGLNTLDSRFATDLTSFSSRPGEAVVEIERTVNSQIVEAGVWIKIAVTLPISPETRQVRVRLSAQENVSNDDSMEFLGHFVDESELAFCGSSPP